jgi:hypothetical protein
MGWLGSAIDNRSGLPCRLEAAKRTTRQLFNVVNAIFCKLHNPCYDQVRKDGIGGTDCSPYPFEGCAHVRGEWGHNVLRIHHLPALAPLPSVTRWPLNWVISGTTLVRFGGADTELALTPRGTGRGRCWP